MAVKLSSISAFSSFALLAFIAGTALAEPPVVPPGKLPPISGQTNVTPQNQAVVCPAPMIRVGNTCDCGPGGVKTSPTTCALRAFVPLQTSDDKDD